MAVKIRRDDVVWTPGGSGVALTDEYEQRGKVLVKVRLFYDNRTARYLARKVTPKVKKVYEFIVTWSNGRNETRTIHGFEALSAAIDDAMAMPGFARYEVRRAG